MLFSCLVLLTEPEVRVVKGACARLRALGRQVFASCVWQAAHLPLLEHLKLGTPTAHVRARLDATDNDAINKPGYPRLMRPLGCALAQRNMPVVRLLLERGADPNLVSYWMLLPGHARASEYLDMMLPLKMAVLDDQPELLLLLLEYGAKRGMANSYLEKRSYLGKKVFLHMAKSPRVASLLISDGAPLDEGADLALYIHAFLKIMGIHAPPGSFGMDQFGREGGPLSHVVVPAGVQWLDPVPPQWDTVAGWTPLHNAVESRNIALLTTLLDAGADVEKGATFTFTKVNALKVRVTIADAVLTVLDYVRIKSFDSEDHRQEILSLVNLRRRV